jgi:hypothetical protein
MVVCLGLDMGVSEFFVVVGNGFSVVRGSGIGKGGVSKTLALLEFELEFKFEIVLIVLLVVLLALGDNGIVIIS